MDDARFEAMFDFFVKRIRDMEPTAMMSEFATLWPDATQEELDHMIGILEDVVGVVVRDKLRLIKPAGSA